MSELAFDEDGQHFQLPAAVARWRTRRFNNPGKPGGAQVVYGDDGLPLFLEVEATAEEFREAVNGIPGRYRLDGVDAHGRVVDGLPPAYLMINGGATASAGAGYGAAPPPAATSLEYALVEMARANSDAIKTMADKFGGICDSVANVVRAADGAGLPRRAPLGPLLLDQPEQGDDDDDEDERNAAPQPAAQPTITTVLAQVMQMVQVFAQMNGRDPAKLGAAMGQVVETAKVVEAASATAPAVPPMDVQSDEADDTRAATTAHRANGTNGVYGTHVTNGAHGMNGEGTRSRANSPGTGRGSQAGSPDTGRVSPNHAPPNGAPGALDPAVHFNQIMVALTPEEQARVQYVITTLSVRDLMQWYDQLANMAIPEAVAKIRAELARVPTEQAA